jgi:ligand-binding SRPBCC domain-containing protein
MGENGNYSAITRIRDGDRGILRVYVGLFPIRWAFEHRDYIEGRQFRDVQTSGPFRRWEHTHSFIPEGPEACRLEDRIEFELPGGFLGDLLGAPLIRRKLERTFEFRHQVTKQAMNQRTKTE